MITKKVVDIIVKGVGEAKFGKVIDQDPGVSDLTLTIVECLICAKD